MCKWKWILFVLFSLSEIPLKDIYLTLAAFFKISSFILNFFFLIPFEFNCLKIKYVVTYCISQSCALIHYHNIERFYIWHSLPLDVALKHQHLRPNQVGASTPPLLRVTRLRWKKTVIFMPQIIQLNRQQNNSAFVEIKPLIHWVNCGNVQDLHPVFPLTVH